MPTDGCSKWGAKWDSIPYMVKVALTYIPFECGVVDPYVDRFFDQGTPPSEHVHRTS